MDDSRSKKFASHGKNKIGEEKEGSYLPSRQKFSMRTGQFPAPSGDAVFRWAAIPKPDARCAHAAGVRWSIRRQHTCVWSDDWCPDAAQCAAGFCRPPARGGLRFPQGVGERCSLFYLNLNFKNYRNNFSILKNRLKMTQDTKNRLTKENTRERFF